MAEVKYLHSVPDEHTKRVTFSVKEAADYLGISTDTIYTMARQKQIPHILCRGRILFRKTTLDLWMDEQEKESWFYSSGDR